MLGKGVHNSDDNTTPKGRSASGEQRGLKICFCPLLGGWQVWQTFQNNWTAAESACCTAAIPGGRHWALVPRTVNKYAGRNVPSDILISVSETWWGSPMAIMIEYPLTLSEQVELIVLRFHRFFSVFFFFFFVFLFWLFVSLIGWCHHNSFPNTHVCSYTCRMKIHLSKLLTQKRLAIEQQSLDVITCSTHLRFLPFQVSACIHHDLEHVAMFVQWNKLDPGRTSTLSHVA